MIVATKTGDKGITGTLFGKRLNKSNEIFSCLGDLDELSAFIGLSKSSINKINKNKVYSHYIELLERIQLNLINLMGELNAQTVDERDSYIQKYSPITQSDLDFLDKDVEFLQELPELQQKTWVLYGKSDVGATLDISAKICRRGERSFVLLNNNNFSHRELLFQYLNRLSDLLYLMARYFDYILK